MGGRGHEETIARAMTHSNEAYLKAYIGLAWVSIDKDCIKKARTNLIPRLKLCVAVKRDFFKKW